MANPYGLGALPSPPDDRDYPVDAAYAALGVTPPLMLAAAYAVAPVPPILNQAQSPECVAFSTASMKDFQDYTDQAPSRWWNFDENSFFYSIGGGPNGAVLRSAMDRLLNFGYPVDGQPQASASDHKIAGYYAVPLDVTSIKQAIVALGEVVLGIQWKNSWFNPLSNGVLPRPDFDAGGHAIVIMGWDDRYGFLLRNSWGGAWGINGTCWLPYTYLEYAFECWKAVDVPTPPAPSSIYHWHVKQGATVRVYSLSSSGCINPGWTTTIWTSGSSSAPCAKPVGRKTCDGTSTATTTHILSGTFAGKTVGVAPPGTSVS